VARDALVDLADLPLRRAGHRGLLARAWELRENVSFYDALYIALAERLDLLTLDARLSRAPGARTEIVVVR
jgi:predicted nucleic acid-binding protein